MSVEETSEIGPVQRQNGNFGDGVSREDLRRVLTDVVEFDRAYIDLTNKTKDAFKSVGRRRGAMRLSACLAALDR